MSRGRDLLSATLRVVYLLAVAIWVGTLVFFSFAATPAIFAALPREEAARAVAALFPAYYRTGWIAGGVALAALLALAGRTGLFGPAAWWRAGLLSLMLALSGYAGVVVLPEVRAARLAGDTAARDTGHRRSVLLNLAVIAAGVSLVALSARDDQKR